MQVLQFKITLLDTDPTIWRRIQIAENCTFWDLHVAIQDAMGWLDYHLHEFRLKDPQSKKNIGIGIPSDEDMDGYRPLASWKINVADYLISNKTIRYIYDFGDSWEHTVLFEGKFTQEEGVKYPLCIDGAQACPPEDVGGIPGFYEFLEAIKDKKHPEHENYMEWVGGKYDPNKFNAKKVKFSSPKSRLKHLIDFSTNVTL
jgi:hypothetical protein